MLDVILQLVIVLLSGGYFLALIGGAYLMISDIIIKYITYDKSPVEYKHLNGCINNAGYIVRAMALTFGIFVGMVVNLLRIPLW